MYDYSYEEYMNNLLGYPMGTRNVSVNTAEPCEEEKNITYTRNKSCIRSMLS